MKKALAVLFTLVMLISTMTAMTLSSSADTLQSGTLGTLSWELNTTTGELTITGEGTMDDVPYPSAWKYHTSAIKSVTIGDGITSIAKEAFFCCTGLESVTIGKDVTFIGDSAFEGCAVKNVTIPEGVTSIGSSVFNSCYRLESITLPEGVTSIGNFAFSYCTSLTSITIPSSVTTIGDGAFASCRNIESITIPEGVTSLESQVFSGCEKLIQKEDYVHYVDNWVIASDKLAINVSLREGTVGIAKDAFSRREDLESVTIPNSVKIIGESAFENCPRLTKMVYCGTEEEWNAVSKGSDWNNGVSADIQFDKKFFGCSSSASGVLFIVPMLGAAAFMIRKKKKQ